ncbi:MAG: hypothetical protein HC842_07000 [Cytophagales bacterium]|nr:hypothetical protein [Cytophagales bacterium]
MSNERIEVDYLRLQGPFFSNLDNRLIALQLVEQGLTNSALIGPDGMIYMPSETFHKKPIMVERGSFRPVTWVNIDMMDSARAAFREHVASNTREGEHGPDDTVEIMEITMRNLLAGGMVDHKDFLARAECISAVGKFTLISNYARYFRLAQYLWRYTKRPIGLVMGVPSLNEILNEKYYDVLEGGILESIGRLFKNDLKLYVYPYDDPQLGRVRRVKEETVSPKLQHLFAFLLDNDCIVGIEPQRDEYMHILSRVVLQRIRDRDPEWETMVPPEVADLIKKRHYFGYNPEPVTH